MRADPLNVSGRHILACAAVLLGAAIVQGCEPCAGVEACRSGPRLAIEGTLLSHTSGTRQRGVHIDIIRRDGVGLATDSVSTTTDADGHWSIIVPATGAGDVTVDIGVRSPEFASYRVTGQRFRTTDRGGDGYVLEPWVVDPYFPYAAEFYYRGPSDIRVAAAVIEFDRISGPDFYLSNGVVDPPYGAVTDNAGRVVLFADNAHATTLGALTGNLVVSLPAPFLPDTIKGVRLDATYLLHTPTRVLRLGVGPSLLYAGEFRERRNNKPAAGVRVVFHRTGGALTDPQTFTATSNADGRFAFPLRALAEGPVVGDLDVTPTLGTPFTVKSVQLRPHRSDDYAFYGTWSVGPALPWVGLVQIGGRGVAGVQAEFHRTGGIAVAPSDYVTTSNSDGFIFLNPVPQSVGVVEADLVIHSPPPFQPLTAHIQLRTVEDDVSGGIAFGWDLDRPTPGASGLNQGENQNFRPRSWTSFPRSGP